MNNPHDERAPMYNKNEWRTPATLFGFINLACIVFYGLQAYFNVSASAGTRLTTLETKMDYYVIPLLQKIDRNTTDVRK